MIKKFKKSSSFALALLVAFALVGVAVYMLYGQKSMDNQGAYIPKENMTTLCVGRFLIDLPKGGKLQGGYSEFDSARLEKPQEKSLEQFQRDMDARESELKSGKGFASNPHPLQASESPDGNSRIFVIWEFPGTEDTADIEGYRWTNGYEYLIKDEVAKSKQQIGLEAMRDYLAKLRYRSNNDIPTEAGYCFDRGLIADPETQNEEAITTFDLPQYPDLQLSIHYFPLAESRHDKPLLVRMGGAVASLGNFANQVHVLRKGDRQVGSFKGQEYLARGPNSGSNVGHLFKWETQGEGTLETPFIEVQMSTANKDKKGNNQHSSLTDEQAIKLWDDILSSLRVRPVGSGPAKTSLNAPAHQTSLGELAATGRSCPETGWWQCVDEGEIVGGRRQFFRQGVTMPKVTFEGEATVWQKLKGERPTYQSATVWKLVDYAETKPDSPPASSGEQIATEEHPEKNSGSSGTDLT